jgi:hypothetical protein
LGKYAGKDEDVSVGAAVAAAAPPPAVVAAPVDAVKTAPQEAAVPETAPDKKDVYVTLRRTNANKNTRVTIRGGNLQEDLFGSEEGLSGKEPLFFDCFLRVFFLFVFVCSFAIIDQSFPIHIKNKRRGTDYSWPGR